MRRILVAAIVIAPAVTHAACPTLPDDPVCRPWSALLEPTVFAIAYAPSDASGPWYGGGVEAAMLWSDNSPAYGPSQGKLRFDIAALGSATAGAGAMALYRGGAQVSLERNASRSWLIPYFDADLGGLWTKGTGGRGFVDGGFGVYVVHRRDLVIDLEVDGVLPFSNPGELGGLRAQLAVSFALW